MENKIEEIRKIIESLAPQQFEITEDGAHRCYIYKKTDHKHRISVDYVKVDILDHDSLRKELKAQLQII